MNRPLIRNGKEMGPPWPVRLTKADCKKITDLQKRSRPRLSRNTIISRAVRYAVPLMLSGKIPIVEQQFVGSAPPDAQPPAEVPAASESPQPAG